MTMTFEPVAEEMICTYEPANNGAGPLWCHGSPTIVRDGNRVFATVPETGKDARPLCNTRWQLFCREDGASWQRIAVQDDFCERECKRRLKIAAVGGRKPRHRGCYVSHPVWDVNSIIGSTV